MKHIVNQFRRMLYDDGRNDRHFAIEQFKLKKAVERLMEATNEVVRASINLKDALISKEDGTLH